MPRTSRDLTIASVAGEAEQVTPVVEPLVHGGAVDEGERSLLGPDEVDDDQQDEAGEQRVGQQLARRGDRDRTGRCSAFDDRFGHWRLPTGSRVPSLGGWPCSGGVSGSRGGPLTVARPRRFRTGF